jgi:hypothetical protein
MEMIRLRRIHAITPPHTDAAVYMDSIDSEQDGV